MSTRVLAVDGGQTGTRAMVASSAGRLEGVGVAGPSTNRQQFASAIRQAVSRPASIDAVVLGLTGAGISDADDAWYRETAAAAAASTAVLLESDAYTGLIGAGGGGDGVLVVGGGGAIALGVSRERRRRAGGLGPILVDEGSGYWLGLEAIRASWRAVEGWGPSTALVGAVCDALGVARVRDSKRRLHAGELSFADVAELAEVVAELARAGDSVAEALLGQAGRALAELALAVLRGTTWPDGATVYTAGRLLQGSQEVANAFRSCVEEGAPDARWGRTKYPAIVGAALLGFGLANEPTPASASLVALTDRWTRATRQIG